MIIKNLAYILIVVTFLISAPTAYLTGQINSSDWTFVEDKKTPDLKYKAFAVSIENFKNKLSHETQVITVPTPAGQFESFEIYPVQVVADEVAHLYTIKTFRGRGIKDPTTLIACDISDGGFHAAVYTQSESYFIEPVSAKQPKQLQVYYKKNKRHKRLACKSSHHSHQNSSSPKKAPSSKTTFRLAIAAAGEYSQQFGGAPYSATNVLNALASGVNMINPIYLRDIGVEFTLVSTAALIFQNPSSDPFDTDDTDFLPEASHEQCTMALGSNSFDIGHLVVWEDLGGLASFEVVCQSATKGEGYSGASGSTVTLWVDYVAHELGHQFGSEHNFTADCNSVDGFRYEPGEGSSIMSYANVCGGDDQYANGSDPFFHYASIAQIQAFVATTSCGIKNASGNTSEPISDAKMDITIPKQTPFILVGSATDGNDPVANLTYDWQQYDGMGPAASGNPNCSALVSPLFRYRPASSDNFRSFPIYNEVLAGNNNGVTWEKLPCAAGTLNFSMAVRDNNPNFGRLTEDRMKVTVANTGPFEVTAPNGGESLTNSMDVTWMVNGTDAHCPNVDILLSLDGGMSYFVVADGTANDGAETITLNGNSTQARILIRCNIPNGYRAGSTFYDTSNGNFSVTASMTVDNDGDGFDNTTDCDDNNPNINPGATEICNGIDDNCDGMTDEGIAVSTYYQDADGDSYGNQNVSLSNCAQPTGYVTNNTDCDDMNSNINPGATDIPNNGIDENCDGIDTTTAIDNDGDGFDSTTDCDDNNPNINPGAAEICNGIDDNCDGMTDEGIPVSTYYQDADGDSYGNQNVNLSNCSQPTGYVANNTDCDDMNSNINPGATDIPNNGIDENCDGADTTTAIDNDGDGFDSTTDCDDNNANINPGATEICNGIDDNCDGMTDEGIPVSTYYQDADGDSYGNQNVSLSNCAQPTGYVANNTDCDDMNSNINPDATDIPNNGIDENCDGVDTITAIDSDGDGFDSSTDCDDTNPDVNPGAIEICNGIDDNCDGMVDEGFVVARYFQDADNDTYGNPSVSLVSCAQPTGYVANSSDCNDMNSMINPGAVDIPDNGIDENCDGADASSIVDNDGDGYDNTEDCDDNDPNINPGAAEICNDIDDNCDGDIDEGLDFFVYYLDNDDDGYGDFDTTIEDCELLDGYAENGDDCDDDDSSINPGATDIPDNGIDENCDGEDATDIVDNDGDGYDNTEDCDDNDPDIYPGAEEICNAIDDNCDGNIDEGLDFLIYYLDEDGDGYGDQDNSIEECELLEGYAENGDDCDDTNPDINPDANDIPNNGIDEDCDGMDNTSSVHELANSVINIYPNPTTGLLNIAVDGNLEYRITVYDLTGKLILKADNAISVNLTNKEAGIYLMELKDLSSGGKVFEKINVINN